MSQPFPPRGPPPQSSDNDQPVRPEPTAIQSLHTDGNLGNSTATLRLDASTSQGPAKKKRNHRGGKKSKKRRQSFAMDPSEDGEGMPETSQSSRNLNEQNNARSSFYRIQGRNQNHSNTSLESEALLDHRDQQPLRARRGSVMATSGFLPGSHYGQSYSNMRKSTESLNRQRTSTRDTNERQEMDDVVDERAPLLPTSVRSKSSAAVFAMEARNNERRGSRHVSRHRRESSISSTNKKTIFDKPSGSPWPDNDTYNVNYPPSVPGSPTLEPTTPNPDLDFGDMMERNDLAQGIQSFDESAVRDSSWAGSPTVDRNLQRRNTIALQAEEDVCFPTEDLSELGEDDLNARHNGATRRGPRRRRGKWPDLSVLDEWSRFEKEGRSGEGAKKVVEPQLVSGRLRPIHRGWHRAEDDAPYRFTYFNEEFQSTIHSQTISELAQGGTFRELFVPDPPELSDSESEESDEESGRDASYLRHTPGQNGGPRAPTRAGSVAPVTSPPPQSRVASISESQRLHDRSASRGDRDSGSATPVSRNHPESTSPKGEKPKRYGDRPIWWLDVLSPTDAEMKVLSKTFGIHPLTAEDIMMQEAREKVELFRNYYFVSYRSFEQDMSNEDFLEPVNMYVVVFREGVISFHFSLTPHPANVRRRIRQLKDYLVLSSDWISYAIIDDITDVFAPLIQTIEDEVDDIDAAILKLHSSEEDDSNSGNEKKSEAGDGTSGESGGDMLRRVGDCRKKVMGLYRLLGNKADVIKGFAKRCNEHWEVAPRSEIGLYLGDIQDHIVTMTGNLSHYEKILARSHGNYLAQINIRMNERQERTADVLGRLTVLGTIVLPMNVVTGLWGMNVWVPGQEYQGNLAWFWSITAGLFIFGVGLFLYARYALKIA